MNEETQGIPMRQPKKLNRAVGILVYNNYPNDSRVRRQAEALVAEGYPVHVVALETYPGKKTYTLEGVIVHQIPQAKKRGGFWRYVAQYGGFFVLGFWKITALFLKHRYSVIHVNNMPNLIVFCALIPKLFGARIILDVHDPFPELYFVKSTSKHKRLFKKLLVFEEKISALFVNHVIATTDLIKDVLVARGIRADKISVLLNSPDPRLFHQMPDNRPRTPQGNNPPFTALYAGTIVKRYGLANIVRALALLKDDIPAMKFKVIGEGNFLVGLQDLITELKLHDVVTLFPSRPVEEIPREYATSDVILWFPDRNEFIDIIMCVKVLEALAMGLPVICTRTNSHAHYFQQGEVTFVDDLNPQALAAAILDLYRNYDQRKPTPEDTERFVARFGWQAEKQKYLQQIARLTAEAR